MVNAKFRITLLKFYVHSFVRFDMRAPIVSIVLNTVKFARITMAINYTKLHCWRKVVMRLTIACVRFHFDLRRHGIPASRNVRWQQQNSIRRLTLRGRRDFWCALTSVYDALIMLSFQKRADTSIVGCGWLSWRFKVKAPPTQMEYWIKRYAIHTQARTQIWILMKATIPLPFPSTRLTCKNCKLNFILPVIS